MHNMFHVSLLKEYEQEGNVQPPPPPDVIDGELEYEVSAVIHNNWGLEEFLEQAREVL